MGIQVNIAEAKAKLSELVARAEAGEEVVIARAGKPAVHLVVKEQARKAGRRQLGLWNHLDLKIPDEVLIGPDPEIEALMDAPIFPIIK